MNCWILLLLLFGCGNRGRSNECGGECGNDYREDCSNNYAEERNCSCENQANNYSNARPASWNDSDCNNDYSANNSYSNNSYSNNSYGNNCSRQDYAGYNRCDTCGCENN